MEITDKVPFLDLVNLHKPLEAELREVFHKAVKTGWFVGGPEVEGFEKEFAEFCGTDYCIGVNSGTDALRFALKAMGIREGDVVITVAHTFIATTEAVSQVGAVPEFIDIDPVSYNMDPVLLRNYVENQCVFDKVSGLLSRKSDGRRVSCIIPVHLYGQPAEMAPILEIAESFGLQVLEDSCQAHGAEYRSGGKWKKAGSLARAAAFSFYPGKNLGAFGEGGAVTTSDEKLAKTISMLRDHGQARKYYHDFEGYNGRLDTIQAGILRIKLRHLSEWNDQRRNVAAIYSRGLKDLENVTTPLEGKNQKHVYHLYVIQVPDREGLMDFLRESNIFTGLHYPVPLHLQKAYSSLGYSIGDLPVTEEVCGRILSLPMFPGLTLEQLERVVKAIGEYTG
jgi:dTDP-4-amino-4,6-dideoxygalactose transaminase